MARPHFGNRLWSLYGAVRTNWYNMKLVELVSVLAPSCFVRSVQVSKKLGIHSSPRFFNKFVIILTLK